MRCFVFLLLCFTCIAPAYADSAAVRAALDHSEKKEWFKAHDYAQQSGRPELIALTKWRSMLDSSSDAPFDDIIHFMQQHPNWPYQSTLQKRAEQSLRDGGFSQDLLLSFYKEQDPITGIGKIMLAGALATVQPENSQRIHRLVRAGWIEGNFDSNMEQYIRKNYASILTDEDHAARIDRLLWEKQTSAASRMLPLIANSRHALYKTRIALIQQSRKSSSLLKQVPSSQRKEQGLVFDRMRYRARRNDDSGVREMLRLVPESNSYPEKWWVYRNQQAREAIKLKHYKTAAAMVTDYDRLESGDLAEALWLDGWMALEYNGKAKEALTLFERMHESVGYPVSLARAAYWAGRAAHKTGQVEKANSWYRKAAAHSTTFYGQLAAIELGGQLPDLPRDSAPSDQTPQNLLERAIQLCIETGEYDIAAQMLAHAIVEAENDDDVMRLAAMGYHGGVPHISVRAGKKALQKHVVLTKVSHPRPQISVDIPIERALMLAIIRQESEFDREARSRANALGMMQLLPSTARYVARKIGEPYKRSQLMEVEYNVTLGSHYLSRMIDSYNGSYVLAIAAYNAGPGNVNKWIKLFGYPGNTPGAVMNWIEHIPFNETRNYVQRVLENLQVYRRLENPDSYRMQMLEEDLLR